jgi:hypothetical protein
MDVPKSSSTQELTSNHKASFTKKKHTRPMANHINYVHTTTTNHHEEEEEDRE